MQFMLMFLLGIGLSLWLRQESLPSSDINSFVNILWRSPWSELCLILPFALSLLFYGYGLRQGQLGVVALRQSVAPGCKSPGDKSTGFPAFALAALMAGMALAGLDTRASDLPAYWTEQLPSPIWVYGRIEGLPGSSSASLHHTLAGMTIHRFQFQAYCWLPLDNQLPVPLPTLFRNVQGGDHSAQKNTPYQRAENHFAENKHITSQSHHAMHPIGAASLQYIGLRGRCARPAERSPSFWRQLQLTMVVETTEELPAPIQPGQWAWLPVKLRLVRGQANPGADDFGRWAFVKRVSVRGTVMRKQSPLWLHRWASLDAWRAQTSTHVREIVSAYPGAQRLLPAIMLGDRRWLDTDDWRNLNQLGLGHLVAISGLHIGFAAAIGYFIGFNGLRLLSGWWPRLAEIFPLQLGAWFLAWSSGAAYSALSGFALPTVRALLALTFLCLCRWRFRKLSLMTVWALSATVLLAYSPRWLYDVSFLLSFGAVGVLIWCMSWQLVREAGWHQAWRLQWGLSVGLSPLNVAFFHQITWFAPFINFVVIPLFSFLLVPLLALACATFVFSPSLGHVLLNFSAMLLESALDLVARTALLPHATSGWMLRSGLQGVSLLFAVGAWLWPRAWRTRLLSVVLLLVSLGHQSFPSVPYGGFRLTMLDVGQGLAVAIETQSHKLVYDPGPAFGDNHQVDRAWLPFLSFYRWEKVNLMVLSHGDADHAGSAEPFVEQVSTDHYMALTPMPALASHGLSFDACHAGKAWEWDGVRFEVLFPAQNDVAVRNTSCVIKVTGQQHSILLTGDIDRSMESKLLSRYGVVHSDGPGGGRGEHHRLRADVLFVPHHGSKTSSSTGLIHHVQPDIALASYGYGNKFGHPHVDVKARYLTRDVRWLSTAEAGAVTVFSVPNQESLIVTSARSARRFWYF